MKPMEKHRVEHLDEAALRAERFDKLAELHAVASTTYCAEMMKPMEKHRVEHLDEAALRV